MANNSTSYIDFSVIYEDRPMKYVGIFSSSVMIVVLLGLCLGIIWYERFGSDLKRILLNRLVSCICWCLVKGMILYWSADVSSYIYRPFPEWVCFMQTILRNSFVTRLIVLFDAIIISRYIFIFHLKNPLHFDDDFWCRFIFWGIYGLR